MAVGATSLRSRALATVALVAAATALAQSRCKTAWVMAPLLSGLALAVPFSFRFSSVRRPLARALVLLALAATSALLIVPESTWRAAGIDLTFSGRTGVWKALAAHALERPWTGHGLASTFAAGSPVVAMPWPAVHAHDGFLQLLLDSGAVGLALGLSVVALALVASFQLAFGERRPGSAVDATWPLVVSVHFLLANVLETRWVHRHGLGFWALVVLALFVARGRIGDLKPTSVR
jgi:O-antigen ligase